MRRLRSTSPRLQLFAPSSRLQGLEPPCGVAYGSLAINGAVWRRGHLLGPLTRTRRSPYKMSSCSPSRPADGDLDARRCGLKCRDHQTAPTAPISQSYGPRPGALTLNRLATSNVVCSFVSSAIFCTSMTSPATRPPDGTKHQPVTGCPASSI